MNRVLTDVRRETRTGTAPSHQQAPRGASRPSAVQHTAPGRAPSDHDADYSDIVYDDDDEAASRRARRALARSSRWRFKNPFRLRRRLSGLRQLVSGRRWLRRAAIGTLALVFLGGAGFGALWLRLGTGPVNFDVLTPWLASAMEDNFGDGYSVDVGGTQIERAGRVRMAVRILDIVVRDREGAVVASAPKAEVRVSGTSLLLGRLRAESINLVGAELSVRIAPDGQITVSTSNANPSAPDARPIELPRAAVALGKPQLPATGAAAGTSASPTAAAARGGAMGLSSVLDWIDSLSATGLDGHELNEVGLKNGNLIVDDQQSGKRWNFENISMSVRRPRAGGVAFSVGEESAARPWNLGLEVGPPVDGVRAIDLRADKVSVKDILLALRMNDMSYDVDIPFSGRLRGEIARDGLPTFLAGKIVASPGTIIDRKAPEYPMAIDRAEFNVEWDSKRRALLAPFQIVSGSNRFTLLAHVEPPGDIVPHWQLGFSGGSVLLGERGEDPVAFNRVAVGIRFDTDSKKVILTQGDISNGDVGIAMSGSIDYSGAEPRLTAGMAATPMSAAVLKRIWPVVITPELREWVIERVLRGSLQRIDVAINAPMNTLARDGPPIPDEGMAINFVASGVTFRPVDELPPVSNADFRAKITGRTVVANIAQGTIETPSGRKMNVGEFQFEIPDMAPKPMQSKIRFRLDGPVPAAAEILASDRLSEFSALPIDPATSRGTVAAQMTLGLPIKGELTKNDTTYTLTADLNNFAAEKLALGQKLEANNLKVQASNQGFQIRGDVRIAGTAASLDYRKLPADTEAEINVRTTLDDAARNRLGFDLGPSVAGSIPLRLNGRLGSGDTGNRFKVEADLTASRIDNALPGWNKVAGRPGKAQFNVTQRPQSTRFDDIVIDGGNVALRGSVELDQNNELVTAVFPTYQPSDGDRASFKAERASDSSIKVTMRGDVFNASGFIKSALAGSSKPEKNAKTPDIDVDVKLGVVPGWGGEAARDLDVKLSRRAGKIRSFSLSGKIGRDASVIGNLRAFPGGREVLYLESADAGAFFRFADSYGKIEGGSMWMAMDPPTGDQQSQEGLINVRDFAVRGEQALSQAAGNAAAVQFSLARAEFTRQAGQLSIKDGVVRGPVIGATISGTMNYAANQVSMRGTFIPAYGLNNMFGQIPILGIFLGGGSNEGLVGITYEVVGSPSQPTLRVNPISAITPGFTRKIFEFQPPQQPVQRQGGFPPSNNFAN